MKTIFTTTLLALSSLLAMAGLPASELFLDSPYGENLVVSIDGQTARSLHDAQPFYLEPGHHDIRVSRIVNNRRARRPVLRNVYNGSLFIPAASRVTARYSGRDLLYIASVVPMTPFRHGPRIPDACYGPAAMTSCDFEQLRSTLYGRNFESTRLDIALQAASCNYFTSAQVRQLLECFTFESTRLEFAKAAYSRTVDRNNFYLVSAAFTFDSTVCELNDYIRTCS